MSVFFFFLFQLFSAGEAWNNLQASEKIPYEGLAEKEKRKYEEAMKIYNQVSDTWKLDFFFFFSKIFFIKSKFFCDKYNQNFIFL